MQEASFSATYFNASSHTVLQDKLHVLICMLAQELSMDLGRLPHIHVLMYVICSIKYQLSVDVYDMLK